MRAPTFRSSGADRKIKKSCSGGRIWNRIPKSRDKTARIHRCGPMLFCYRIENISLKQRELEPADISRERCPCRHGRGAGRNKQAADGREESMHSTKRSTLRNFAALAAMALGVVFGGNAQAAGYPERPIELIVPWGPGGGADQLARLISKLMEPMLGQGIPVVNVPGGTGATGMAKLLAAPADGYSMAIYIADSHALLAGKSPRWTMNDITPVAVMIKGPSFIFVKQDSRFKTWEDFAKEAKANPNKLKVATLGFGSVDDFSLTVLDRGGVKVVQVPFSKPSERYVSILGDHADALYEQAGDVAQFLTSKQMRPILLFGEKRLPAFKDVPSSYEVGYKVALPQFRSIVVRAGTPPDVVKKLSDALHKVYESPEYKKFLEEQFADPNSFEDASKAPAFVDEQLNDMKKTMVTN